MNIFSSDGWFSRIFGTIGDIIIVNFLFIICSIPIVTMGASMSAMYYTLLKKQRTGEYGGIVKTFFKGFKDNFKQSTIAWILFLLVSFIFSMDFNLFGKGGPQENSAMYYTCVVLFILTCFIAIYLFPVICAFENTLKNLILQAIFFAAKNFIFTILIMILYTLPIYFLLANPQVFMVGIFILIVCGFGLIAYLASFMFNKAFSPYLEDVTKQYSDDDPDSWMKPIDTSDKALEKKDSEEQGSADQSGNNKDQDQKDSDKKDSDKKDSNKKDSDQEASQPVDPRKVTKKLEVSNPSRK